MSVRELPMFPLGSVLLPGMALPLRVFEPRYLAMVAEVLERDVGEFGVVLIERGSEVGGGDVRTDVGCIAEVHAARDVGDGTLEILAVGTERVRVLEWLPDAPFPRALVEDWPDPPEDPAGGREDPAGAALEALTRDVRQLASEIAAQLGRAEDRTTPLSDDPGLRLYQLAVLAPLGSLDRHRVLCAESAQERATLLGDLVHEQRILLEARRRFSDP